MGLILFYHLVLLEEISLVQLQMVLLVQSLYKILVLMDSILLNKTVNLSELLSNLINQQLLISEYTLVQVCVQEPSVFLEMIPLMNTSYNSVLSLEVVHSLMLVQSKFSSIWDPTSMF